MALRTFKFIFILAALVAGGCKSVQHISKATVSYEVPGKQSDPATDEVIQTLITPYKSQLDEKMNQVIANVGTELSKKQPESTMGNWVTDAMMEGVLHAGLQADFAINNYGGMRVPVIMPGPLTIGEIYELSPFDNMLMIVDMPGAYVDSLFQYIAGRDGWPVSGNIRMVMKAKKMISYTINDKPVDYNQVYRAAVPDYVANGGDDARFMIGLKRLQTGLLLRNVIIDQAVETARMGRDIQVTLEGRITIQQ